MSGSDDLSKFMVPYQPDFGYYQGTVVAWDSLTGTNIVNVNGSNLANLDVLASSDAAFIAPGDAVLVLKFRSSLCVMGRIMQAGSGSLGVRDAVASATGFRTATTYGDLSIGAGPTVTDVTIGSNRKCIVTICTAIYADTDDAGAAHIAVTGASTINPPTGTSAFSEGAFLGSSIGGSAAEGTATKQFILTAAHGLNKGKNTFTMKYLSRAGGDAFFSDRVITVIPF